MSQSLGGWKKKNEWKKISNHTFATSSNILISTSCRTSKSNVNWKIQKNVNSSSNSKHIHSGNKYCTIPELLISDAVGDQQPHHMAAGGVCPPHTPQWNSLYCQRPSGWRTFPISDWQKSQQLSIQLNATIGKFDTGKLLSASTTSLKGTPLLLDRKQEPQKWG